MRRDTRTLENAERAVDERRVARLHRRAIGADRNQLVGRGRIERGGISLSGAARIALGIGCTGLDIVGEIGGARACRRGRGKRAGEKRDDQRGLTYSDNWGLHRLRGPPN